MNRGKSNHDVIKENNEDKPTKMTSLENHEDIFDVVLQPETNSAEKTCSETNVLQESRPPFTYYDLIIMALRSSPG